MKTIKELYKELEVRRMSNPSNSRSNPGEAGGLSFGNYPSSYLDSSGNKSAGLGGGYQGKKNVFQHLLPQRQSPGLIYPSEIKKGNIVRDYSAPGNGSSMASSNYETRSSNNSYRAGSSSTNENKSTQNTYNFSNKISPSRQVISGGNANAMTSSGLGNKSAMSKNNILNSNRLFQGSPFQIKKSSAGSAVPNLQDKKRSMPSDSDISKLNSSGLGQPAASGRPNPKMLFGNFVSHNEKRGDSKEQKSSPSPVKLSHNNGYGVLLLQEQKQQIQEHIKKQKEKMLKRQMQESRAPSSQGGELGERSQSPFLNMANSQYHHNITGQHYNLNSANFHNDKQESAVHQELLRNNPFLNLMNMKNIKISQKAPERESDSCSGIEK